MHAIEDGRTQKAGQPIPDTVLLSPQGWWKSVCERDLVCPRENVPVKSEDAVAWKNQGDDPSYARCHGSNCHGSGQNQPPVIRSANSHFVLTDSGSPPPSRSLSQTLLSVLPHASWHDVAFRQPKASSPGHGNHLAEVPLEVRRRQE